MLALLFIFMFWIQSSNAANATSPPPATPLASNSSPPAANSSTTPPPDSPVSSPPPQQKASSPSPPTTPSPSPSPPVQTSSPVFTNIGVNYGQLADNLPPPQQVAKLLQSTLIGKIRIFNTDSALLQAFANTGIDVVVGVSNDQVPGFTNANLAQQWVSQNIAPFAPATRIKLITVGNEVFTINDRQLSSWILPAIKNIHAALVALKLDDSIKVSTPHSFAILSTSFPPSGGTFRQDSEMYVKPLLQFLSDTKSPLLVNAYPYFAYRHSPKDIPLSYALFLPNPGAVDPKTGLIYSNLYTAQIDAAYSAMEKMGFFGIPISVTETGWPSYGDVDEVGVTMQNAMTFNRNLIAYVSSNSGTPLRPRQPVDTYIFALFNEDLKSGPASERNYGLFRTDGSAVYDCGLMKSGSSAAVVNPPTQAPISSSSSSSPASSSSSSSAPARSARSWCLAKPNADASALLKALNYACGEGEADCSAIQPGGVCFYPDDLKSHSSYAFNMYYQKYGHNLWNCNFGNTATVTRTDPSYGSCRYPGSNF